MTRTSERSVRSRAVRRSARAILLGATAALLGIVGSTASVAQAQVDNRSKWLDPKAVTTDDLRRVPQLPGYADHNVSLALVGGRLFDGTGKPARPATVLTKGKRIEAILEPGASNFPSTTTVVDVTGKTILPGMIDLHVHTTFSLPWQNSPPLSPAVSSESPTDAALRGAVRLQYYLESGITSIRDLGANGLAPFILAEYFQRNLLTGPRVFAAGQMITGLGGHTTERYNYFTAPAHPDAWTYEATGADGWREAVRTQFKKGANVIKVASHFTLDEIRAAVDEAHTLGLRVVVDAEPPYLDAAIEAGVDCVEHPMARTDAAIKKMKEKNIASVPTMVRYKLVNGRGGYVGSTSRRFTLSNEMIMDVSRKMRKAGIKMGVGLDLVGDPGVMPTPYIDELKNFVEIGYTVEEALVAATRTNSEILGLDDKLGTVEPGKLADIVVIDGQPDQRLDDLAKVDVVIVNGRVRVRDGRLFVPRHGPVRE